MYLRYYKGGGKKIRRGEEKEEKRIYKTGRLTYKVS
jgi:hypothetical protein